MIVAITKLDTPQVNYDEKRFNEIKEEVTDYLKQIGYDTDKIPFVPISGWKGDNVIEKSENLKWYKGGTFLETLDKLKQPRRPTWKPLRIPI